LTLGLLWVLALCFAGGIRSETIDEGNDDLFDVDFRVELGCCRKERSECVEMEFIRENLDTIYSAHFREGGN
jgi:hypothetical protein